MICSPMLAGEKLPGCVGRSPCYDASLFLYLAPSLSLFPSLSLSLHQIREEYFILLSSERKTDYIGVFVESGLAISKTDFDVFFSMPSTCSPLSHSSIIIIINTFLLMNHNHYILAT